jgi:1-acyl-sn-glycerol-3-phosphate acyltransferase
VALFGLAFALLELFTFAYQLLLIIVPGALVPSYGRRYHRGLWNWIISFWGATTCRLARWTTGLRVELEGRIPPGAHIIVSNHQSSADIFLLFEVFREKNLKFVVKKQLLRWLPVISYALRHGGFGVVDFGSRLKTVEGMKGFAHSLAGWKGSPLIFPEGIRSLDGSMAPFKTAGMRLLARETGLPVLPVVIDGLWRARTVWKYPLHLPGARCRVSILPPVSRPAEGEADDPLGEIEELMRRELARLRGGPEAAPRAGRSEG